MKIKCVEDSDGQIHEVRICDYPGCEHMAKHFCVLCTGVCFCNRHHSCYSPKYPLCWSHGGPRTEQQYRRLFPPQYDPPAAYLTEA